MTFKAMRLYELMTEWDKIKEEIWKLNPGMFQHSNVEEIMKNNLPKNMKSKTDSY